MKLYSTALNIEDLSDSLYSITSRRIKNINPLNTFLNFYRTDNN